MFSYLLTFLLLDLLQLKKKCYYANPCKKLPKQKDVFEAVSFYFDHNLIKWENLVSVCKNGALEMLGS